MRLKLGVFASSGGASFFQGIVNWLTGNDSGKLFASEDGTTFAQVNTDVFGTSNVNDVFYGPDISTVTTTPNKINTGDDWFFSNSNFSNIYTPGYGNGMWILGGSPNHIVKSTNGLNWTTIISNFTILHATYGNGIWVANGGNKHFRVSTDTVTWTTVALDPGGIRTFDLITYGNGIWLATGTYGVARRSTNGSTWTTVTPDLTNEGSHVEGVAFGNNIFVAAVSSLGLKRSTDAISWTTISSSTMTGGARSIGYGNGLWVVGSGFGQMRTSTDTITWTTVTSNFGNTYIISISYGNGLWFAGGYSQLRKSTNGSTWTTVTTNLGTTMIEVIAYGNGLWTMTGAFMRNLLITKQLYDYQYGSNTFLAAADAGKLAKSSDGLTWTTVNIDGQDNYKTITHGEDIYYAGG